jgi:hypothetical protein
MNTDQTFFQQQLETSARALKGLAIYGITLTVLGCISAYTWAYYSF